MGTRFRIEPVSDDALRLEQAILIYRSRNRRALATIHPVGEHRGQPVILAGAAMTVAASRVLARELTEQSSLTFLPPELLYCAPNLLVWWAPPATRYMWFRAPEFGGAECGARVALPGSVFLADARGCRVWAVKGASRPTPETALWHAPYFNVAEDGTICWGNVSMPAAIGPEGTAEWTAAFFGSYFTHPNAAGKVVRHREGAYGFWRAMLTGEYRRFPASVLLPTGLALRELVEKEWHRD
jgi:PRTRC genetic system protein B